MPKELMMSVVVYTGNRWGKSAKTKFMIIVVLLMLFSLLLSLLLYLSSIYVDLKMLVDVYS